MRNKNYNKSSLRLSLGLSVVFLLSACGGSGGAGQDAEQPLSDASVQGLSAGPIAEDFGTTEFTPDADDLLVDFELPEQDLESSTDFIGDQWIHMQTCLQVSAQEPVVTVVDGPITPVSSDDDVVRHIDGQIQASANVTDSSVSVQVRTADLDGSIGRPGSYLRSIFGRYLWLTNGLAERDYPYTCANGE